VHSPDHPKAGLVIAHGRSNDLRNPLVRRIVEAVALEGIWALRFNFRYADVKGQASRDPSREEADLRGAVRFAREALPSQRIFVAGKSMGRGSAPRLPRIRMLPASLHWAIPSTPGSGPRS